MAFRTERSRLYVLALVAWCAAACDGTTTPPPPPPRGSAAPQAKAPDEPLAGERAEDPGEPSDPEGADDSDSPIVGVWLHNVRGCSYTHTFDGQGIYTSESTTGERVKARYTLSDAPSDVGRWQLDFTIFSDNNRVDCEGDMIDEVGNSITVFVALTEDTAEFYRGPDNGSPLMVWTRTD